MSRGSWGIRGRGGGGRILGVGGIGGGGIEEGLWRWRRNGDVGKLVVPGIE